MRVALVSNLRGGLRQFITRLYVGLTNEGFRIDVLCPAHPYAATIGYGTEIKKIHFGLSAIGKLLVGQYDLVHFNIAALGLIPFVRKNISNLRTLETFHGIPQWWLELGVAEKLRYAIEYNVIQLVADSTRYRISVSNYVKGALEGWLGIDSLVIYHGLDSSSTPRPPRDESRRQLGIDEETIAVLFVGRLHPYKDPLTLARAVALLAREVANIKLIVVGDGPLSNAFHRTVRELGIQNSVLNWNHVSDAALHAIYQATDIFCLPSINEAFGMVLLEAMSHSLPLVISKSGALPEIAGEAGVTFSAGNEVELFQELLRLAKDSALRRRIGEAARQRLERQFSHRSMVEQYCRIYERAGA